MESENFIYEVYKMVLYEGCLETLEQDYYRKYDDCKNKYSDLFHIFKDFCQDKSDENITIEEHDAIYSDEYISYQIGIQKIKLL